MPADFMRRAVSGRGFGMVAARPIRSGELILREMPLAVCQERASALVTPGCVSCLRCCEAPREALQRALELIGEQTLPSGCSLQPCSAAVAAADQRSCPSCGAAFCGHG
eukprot:4733984-Prymnesium_polylepis.1